MSSVEGVSSDMNASVVHTKVFFVTSSEDWVDMRSLTKGLWSRHEVAGQIQTFTIQHGVSMEKLCVRYLHHGWRDESSQNENTKAFLGWLVESCDGPMIGFDAKCGQSAVRLIQLSTATRCLILRLPSDAEKHDYLESGRRIFSSDVRAFFEDGSMMKAGSDVWRSGVKLWSDTEGAINGALNIARAKAFTGELPSLEEMCEMVCGNGSFYQDAASVHSDWDRDELTLRQLVAAALDAQANYVVTAKLSPNQWPAPISLSLKPATSESKENSSANSQTRLRTEETDRKIVNAGVTQSASASSVPPPSVSYTPQHGESMTQTSNVSSSNPPPLPALSSSNAATASSSQASWSSVVNHAVATAHPPPSTRPSSSAANAVSVTPSKSHPTDPSISEPYLIHLLQGCLGDSGYRIFLLGNHFTHKTGRFWRTLSGGVSLKDFILQHVDDGYFKVEEVGHKDGMLVKNGRLVRFESMPPPVDSLLAAPSKSVDSSFSAKYSKHPANTPFSDLTLIRLLRDIVGKAGVYYFDIGSYFRDSHHGLTWKTASGEQGLKNFILAYAQKGYFAIEQSDHPNPQNCIVKQGSKEPSESDFDTLHDGSTTSTSTSAPSSFSYSNGIVSHISERIPTNSTSSSSTSLPSNPRSTSSSASSARRAPLSDACLIYLLHQCLDENGCSVCDFGGTFTKASRGHYWRTVAANESLHKFVMRHVSEGYFSVEDRGPPHGIFVKKGRPVRLTHADHAALASLSSSATSASITESGLIATLHSALGEQGRYICNLGPAFTNFNSGRPWSTVAPNGEALKPFIMRHIQDGYFTFTDDGDLRGIFVKKGPAQPVSSSSSLSSSSSSFSHKTQPPHTSAPTSDSELIRLLQSAIPIEGEHMFRLVNQSHS